MFIGLFNICYISFWLVTHPITFENLGIDLHQHISSENESNLFIEY